MPPGNTILRPRPSLITTLGLMLVLGLAALPACDNDAQPKLHSMTPAELDEALASKDFLLINVHIPYDGEIPGTDTHIEYTDIDAIVDYIGPDLGTKVVIYCKSDHMTDIAGPELVARGYRAVFYLEGGMNAWTAEGFSLDP